MGGLRPKTRKIGDINVRKPSQNEGRSDCQEVHMLKTGDELRAAANERVRRCRAKQAAQIIKHVDQVKIFQFSITIRLPLVSIRKIS
jgi:hypothetical protein